MGVSTMGIESAGTPAISEEKLAECDRLLIGCRRMSSSAWMLSRLASSLARTGVHRTFDKVLDSVIASEVMHQLGASRGRGGQLARQARSLRGEDRDDLIWIRGTAEPIYAARTGIIHDGTLPTRFMKTPSSWVEGPCSTWSDRAISWIWRTPRESMVRR